MARALPYWRKVRRLFDPAFYLRKYPDVAAAGIDPLRHYIEYGAAESRKPHPLFDPAYYVLRCPEAGSRGEFPLLHFLASRGKSCANPHPLFDCELYLHAHPEAAERGLNPLLHYAAAVRAAAAPEPHSGSGGARMDAACFEILDAPLVIVFPEPGFELRDLQSRALQAGLAGDVVPVWEEPSGRLGFLAPPQQRPFFEAMKYDQLRAQASRKI
jgi:hypothetical protein